MFRLLRTVFLWLLRALRVLAPGSNDGPRRPARAPLPRTAPTKRSKSAPRASSPAARAVPDATGGLQIQYAPKADGGADPGEVVWTWVPYEDDPAQGKDRPVLVIGYQGRRRVGLALTSKDTGRHDHVEIGTGPWDRDGRTSYAKLDRLIDLELMPIRREGAVLDRARFDGVARALRRVGRA